MQAIINGKRYDTEKAILLGSDSSNCGRSDFDWFSESLYKTPRSGAYFLAGEGNARSRYAKSMGNNSWCGGDRIIPLDRAAAYEWAERARAWDLIEAEFADMVQDA